MRLKAVVAVCVMVFLAQTAAAEEWLRDRGAGSPTSMFGSYIEKGELLFYPFYEHYFDQNAEYSPLELGYGLDEDFRGKFRASEFLIFAGYGLTDALNIEFEAAMIDAELERAANDPTAVPDDVSESGLGDVQTQINWMWSRETVSRPAFFSFFETVYPLQKDKKLIGTSDWELKFGTGMVRGFKWGTMTIRAAAEYNRSERTFDLGEIAVEYLRRLSSSWRVYTGVEGTQDEIELITELQWHFTPGAYAKINNAFGITSKATDWAPEVGLMMSLWGAGSGLRGLGH